MNLPHNRRVIPQGLSGVGCGVQHDVFRWAHHHHVAACVAPLGPQVNQPVTGAHDV